MRRLRNKSVEFLSKLGFSLSVLCAIHCLAMPFIFAFAPFLGSFISHSTEIYLVLVSAGLAVVVFWKSYQEHHNLLPIALFLLSVMASLSGLFLFHETLEIPLMATGGIVMAFAYYLNWKIRRKVSTGHFS